MEHTGDIATQAAEARPGRQTIPTASARLPDGRLLELVRDGEVTSLAVWQENHVRLVRDVSLGTLRRLMPYSASNNLIAHGVVKLPSAPVEYGSEAELIASVRDFIHRYVDVSPRFEHIATYYVLLTWVFDSFNELPYLRVRGEPGTGKTRFLLTVGSMCYRPIFASGASTVSPLFRILDAMGGTLVIDESDFRLSDEKAEVVKILNNGNVRGFPVLRSEQVRGSKEFNPRAYHVFGPKIVATRSFFEDRALESRLLSEQMEADGLRTNVPISLPDVHEEEALQLRNKLLLYRFRTLRRPRDMERADSTLSPRLRQVFAPLLSLVEDETALADVLSLAREYEADLVTDRGLAVEASLVGVVEELRAETGRLPSLQEIGRRFAERHGDEHHDMTIRRIGWLLRKRLGLNTVKSHGIYVIASGEEPKLDRLVKRYGVQGEPTAESSPPSPPSPPGPAVAA